MVYENLTPAVATATSDTDAAYTPNFVLYLTIFIFVILLVILVEVFSIHSILVNKST